jgi:mono/diheme cytochrome c family protein
MSFVRRHAVPFAAALAAATAAFAVVVLTTNENLTTSERPTGNARETQPASDGLAVFTRMGCGGCHRLAAAHSTGPIGPDLDARLPSHTRESLTAQILSPSAGSMMPGDFGERMTDADLTALVDFLLAVREPR